MSYLQQVGCTGWDTRRCLQAALVPAGQHLRGFSCISRSNPVSSLQVGGGGLQSMSRAPQSLGLRGSEQSCAKASDEMWLLAGGSCSCSSFERSWERRPKTTTGESVQMKGLVSVRVPSAVFSGSSVISCHFGIWAYWTSASMD